MKNPSDQAPSFPAANSVSANLAKYAAICGVAIALTTLLGWVFDVTVLKSIRANWSSIKPNTSIAFACSGIALLFSGKQNRLTSNVARCAACIVLFIGSITAAEYLFNWNSGIDELFFNDNTTAGTGVPGRMSPFAAINFILMGTTLLIHNRSYKYVIRLVNTLALMIFALGLLQFNAYIFGISELYKSWSFTQMSFSASVLYMVLALGIIAQSKNGGFLAVFLENTKTGKVALRQLVTVFLLLICVSWLRVQGQNLGFYPTEIGVSLVVVVSFLIVATVLWEGSRVIGKAEKKQLALTLQVTQAKDDLAILNFDLQKEIEIRKAKEQEILKLNTELERKVFERTGQLQQINKELEAFSYSVSHDLRAPLRAVNGYAIMLLEDYCNVLDDEGKRLLNTIVSNGKMMGRLIDDLLKFSRLGKLEAVNEAVNMNKLVSECLSELQLVNQHVSYTVNVDQLQFCRGDEHMLKQVWFNLLDNAIKYSSKCEAPHIQVSCRSEDDRLIFSVKDNGAGFDMQYADKLFGVFQRLHRNDEFEGSGIGLALVQRIISKHNGSIWAEAETGKGATFYFSLPKTSNNE
jgi:signal transduction histidine kinase